MFACRHRPFELDHAHTEPLVARYREPQRAYHTLAHIAELLGWFDRIADEVGWTQPAEIYAAILYHDAIYVPGAKDNERKSARMALLGVPDGVDRERVTALIELTARHGHLAVEDVDADAALFLDSDMAILGAEAAAFDAYDAQIAIEYQHVPPEAYRAGRHAFLAGIAAKSRIFLSDYFHARLDAAARANLARALAA